MKINLFEGVSDEDIQRSLNLIHNNLKNIVYKQSHIHTFKKHSDKTDAYLKMRIFKDNKKSSTSYYTHEDAKRCCLKAMEEKWFIIEDFLNGSDEIVDIFFDFGKNESIGYGYIQGIDGVFEDCHACIVVLQKDASLDWGFNVLTTYPVITIDLEPEEI